jgi:hypothetical protein
LWVTEYGGQESRWMAEGIMQLSAQVGIMEAKCSHACVCMCACVHDEITLYHIYMVYHIRTVCVFVCGCEWVEIC